MTGVLQLFAWLGAAGGTARQALEPLPASPPIGGPFWTVLVPALLLAGSSLGTILLYRRFAGTRSRGVEAERDGEAEG